MRLTKQRTSLCTAGAALLLAMAAASVPTDGALTVDQEMTASGTSQLGTEEISFAAIVNRWNGAFLWSPASASTNPITRFGDEARAVFGPIPDADCTDRTARTLPLEVDGNIVDLKPNIDKPGRPLEFEHRDPAGNLLKWTKYVARCDKPSLAGDVTYCGMNSRMNRSVRGNVEWLVLCRKSSRYLELEPISYWQKSNPKFARLGTIGFNQQTGEIVFFDGRKERSEFDWTEPFVPPGGRSYSDHDGRKAAEALYDPTFQVQCSACHDNKGPYVVDPHISLARVGYQAGTNGKEAAVFSLGSYLPKARRSETTPFRVVGSAYTRTYNLELARAKTVRDPTGNCTECHTLTTQVTGQRFAADAVAQEPSILEPSWAQILQLRAERMKLGEISAHRTDWALRSGAGKIHPWMVPRDGNNVAAIGPEISADDWQLLSNCLWEAGGEECGYRPLYSVCPAPGTQSGGDGSDPTGAAATVLPSPLGEKNIDRQLRLSWKYLNGYGDVPQRDDVRFDVAVRSFPIPPSGEAPSDGDYPSLSATRGENFSAIAGEIGISGTTVLIRNISYWGHRRFTEPAPSAVPREFRIDLPAQCNRRFLARILPKRFCFDQTGMKYADRGQLVFADITCS